MHLLQARTADDLWLQAADRLRRRDGTLEQPSRRGPTIELLHTCLVLEDARQRWIVNREPAMNPAFALAEVVWILNGRNDSSFLNFWNPKLQKYAGSGDTYHGAYGFRLRRHFGIDQIQMAYETLEKDPHSRQVVLQIWDSRGDLPITQGRPRDEDIPCNVCSLVKRREGRLEWVQVMRSNDLVLGLPHNIIQFTHLQELMAGWLGCEVGHYTHMSDSLHVYENALGSVEAGTPVAVAENLDQWKLGFHETMLLMDGIADRMDAMRQRDTTEDQLLESCAAPEYPIPAQNLLRIVGADAARRQKMPVLCSRLAAECSNPILSQMWNGWTQRQEDRHVRERT